MSAKSTNENLTEYVTATIGGQLFGMPILRVQDVFMPERLTRVPLAPPEIAGVLNLRGRIVTLIDMRCRLGLGQRGDDGSAMAIGVECAGESYGLLIDQVGEVLTFDDAGREPNPTNLESAFGARVGGHPSPRRKITHCPRRRPDSRYRRRRRWRHEKVWQFQQMNQNGEGAMKTCLIVDDSSVIRKVARRILEGLEFQIVEAEDGEQALEACRTHLPEAILLDWNMPKMDGYEFLR